MSVETKSQILLSIGEQIEAAEQKHGPWTQDDLNNLSQITARLSDSEHARIIYILANFNLEEVNRSLQPYYNNFSTHYYR